MLTLHSSHRLFARMKKAGRGRCLINPGASNATRSMQAAVGPNHWTSVTHYPWRQGGSKDNVNDDENEIPKCFYDAVAVYTS
jgi:hypothetical protein